MKKLKKITKADIITLKRLLEYMKKSRTLLIFSLILSALFTISSLLVPIYIGRAIDRIIPLSETVPSDVVGELLIAVLFVILGGASSLLLGFVNAKITYSLLNRLRKAEFEKIGNVKISYTDGHPHGDIVSRIISDTEVVCDGVLLALSQFFTGVLAIISTIIIMFLINPIIALAVFVLTPLSLVVSSYIAKKTSGYFKVQAEIKGQTTANINESVTELETINLLGINDIQSEEFYSYNEKYRKSSQDAVFFSSLVNPTTRFVNASIYACVAGLGGIYCISGGLSVGTLSVFLDYAGQYTKPFNQITEVIAELQNAIACASRVFDFLDTEEIDRSNEQNVLDDVCGNLKIENLTFGYTEDKILYNGFSLDVKSGQKIAIVGPTGCGKTTLINLLMRFYSPLGGKITIDGVDISLIKRDSLRAMFGMVLQDTFIIHGTVRENLKMANPTASDAEMISSAEKTHCHGFVTRLKDGYDTVLDEGGEGLSDGQKQLLCICRAMISNPKILILDEATSSIDTLTEKKVQDAMTELSRGRTSFIVAHRLSTIVGADMIIALKKGEVMECGTHKELMSKHGYYYDLYNSQFADKKA